MMTAKRWGKLPLSSGLAHCPYEVAAQVCEQDATVGFSVANDNCLRRINWQHDSHLLSAFLRSVFDRIFLLLSFKTKKLIDESMTVDLIVKSVKPHKKR